MAKYKSREPKGDEMSNRADTSHTASLARARAIFGSPIRDIYHAARNNGMTREVATNAIHKGLLAGGAKLPRVDVLFFVVLVWESERVGAPVVTCPSCGRLPCVARPSYRTAEQVTWCAPIATPTGPEVAPAAKCNGNCPGPCDDCDRP